MLALKRPCDELAPSYLEFIAEMAESGEKIWEGFLPKSGESLHAFVQRKFIADTHPEPGLVPETMYWATLIGTDSTIVGRIALRHTLNDNLKEFGGHIGYEVRPSYRRKGFATEMLRQLLLTPKAREIGKIMLTCAPDNVASNKTILTNGGVLSKTAFVERVQRDTNYYWITLN